MNSGSEPAPPVQEQRPARRVAKQNVADEEESWDHVSFFGFDSCRFTICVCSSIFNFYSNFCDFISLQYNTPSYNPQLYAMNANVLRQPVGMSPAQRRQFADNERKRLSEINRPRPGQQFPR